MATAIVSITIWQYFLQDLVLYDNGARSAKEIRESFILIKLEYVEECLMCLLQIEADRLNHRINVAGLLARAFSDA